MLAAASAAAVRGAEPGTSGWASHYGPGNGVAMHFCTWTLRHASGCGWVRIQSADTGLVVEAPVVDYCFCHVEPSSHPDRIVDLQYGVVDALGLDRSQGLYQVTVWLIPDGPAFLPDQDIGIPDTAAAERGSLSVLVLALAALALLMQAISEWRARRPQPPLDEEPVATIYARAGRLVLRRRRP